MNDILEVKPNMKRESTNMQKLDDNGSHNDDKKHYYEMPLIHKLFKLQGRIGRLDYFILNILTTILFYAPLFLFLFISQYSYMANDVVSTAFWILLILDFIFIAWMNICLAVKRCHDLGNSAWMMLLLFIPIANIFFGLYLLFVAGEDGPNKYGINTGILER